jgi:hypothetical protein
VYKRCSSRVGQSFSATWVRLRCDRKKGKGFWKEMDERGRRGERSAYGGASLVSG